MNASMEHLRCPDGALCYRAAAGIEWTDTTGRGHSRSERGHARYGQARQRVAEYPVGADPQRRRAPG